MSLPNHIMGVIRGMRDAGIGGYASSAELLIALEGEMNASASKKERGSAGCRQRRDFPVSPVDASSEPFKNTATSRSLSLSRSPPLNCEGALHLAALELEMVQMAGLNATLIQTFHCSQNDIKVNSKWRLCHQLETNSNTSNRIVL